MSIAAQGWTDEKVATKDRRVSRDRVPISKRVLFIVDSFNFGGAENLIAELGRCARPGWELSVASLEPAGHGRNAMLNRLVEANLNPSHLSVRRLLDPVGFVKLVRTLRASNADIVHAHLDYAAILVPIAARLAGKPVVATLHMNPQRHRARADKFKERLAVRIPSWCGRLVLVSQSAYDEYADRYGPPSSRWRVIPNGIDLRRYGPQHRLSSTTSPVWAVVAALRPDKNHVDLVRAWQGVVAECPNARLLVIGDGPARDDIERVIAETGMMNSVELLGRREDVHEILRTVDGVVSASVDEALPTALIEAAACGLPLVAADAGGTREIVHDGVTGRLVPVRDVPSLTAALLDVIRHPARAAKYGAAGRALVEKRYSFSVWTNELEALYSEVINEHTAHALKEVDAWRALAQYENASPL
jgi:glycosyltransferase involved in cell wall biosynthesis